MNVSMRKCGHEGVDELLWVTADVGAFGSETDGPLYDWISCKEYFIEKVKKFDVIIQAGGNCGMYARFYSNYFKSVYTFEPDPTNFHCLDHNCQGDSYVKYHGGLGNSNELLSIDNSSTVNVGVHKILNRPGNIQMYKIDDLRLEECDLIHLDVEGYEEEVLKGAVKTIQKFYPVIITERAGGKNFLQELGYSKYRTLRMDTVFIKI